MDEKAPGALMILGIDFDNTIISYDDLIHQIAVEKNLVPTSTPKNKKNIRDAIRKLPEGEKHWQSIQGIIYGQRVSEATPQPGFLDFFPLALKKFSRVYIVSHKTETSPFDPTRSPLREAALLWMEKHGLFNHGAFNKQNVFFASTKEEKIEKISSLNCTHFIDDLEEILTHENFPATAEKILYSPDAPSDLSKNLRHRRSWNEIQRDLLS